MPGQRHELSKAGDLLVHAVGRVCIADTGYDAEHFRDAITFLGVKPVIPHHPLHAKLRRHDKELYALRHLLEVFFHGLKRFGRLASRYEKSARNYLALIHIASIRMRLN
jgi:transposase